RHLFALMHALSRTRRRARLRVFVAAFILVLVLAAHPSRDARRERTVGEGEVIEELEGRLRPRRDLRADRHRLSGGATARQVLDADVEGKLRHGDQRIGGWLWGGAPSRPPELPPPETPQR